MNSQKLAWALSAVAVSWCCGPLAWLTVECRAAGPRLLYVQSIGEMKSGKRRQLVDDTDYNVQGSPDWSADGKMIAFDAWRDGGSFSGAHIFVVQADGKNLKDLGTGAMPSFSPDGKRIAFSSPGVQIMKADGTDRQMLDPSGWGGQWSPDGKSIAYAKGGNMVIMKLETKEQRTILEGEHAALYSSLYWNLGWSRDSKYVCFKARRRDNSQFEVPVVDVSGSSNGFQLLVKQATNADFAWHPDGKRILLSMRDPMRKVQQLYLIDRENPETPKSVPGQPKDRGNLDADWSPDGKQIVYASRNVMGQ